MKNCRPLARERNLASDTTPFRLIGTPIRLIGMSGSLRSGSYSNAVLETLGEKFAGRADLTIYDLRPIPLYDQDFEGEKRQSRSRSCFRRSPRATGSCCARRSSTT